MQVTIPQLQAWYKEFNGIVFNYDMPKVTFILTNTRKTLGQAQRRGTSYYIKISNFYEGTKEHFRNVLLHEMCHIWCYFHGYRDDHHTGYHWREITEIARKKTGILITRTTSINDLKPAKRNEAKMQAVKARKEAPAILVDIDFGKYHFIVKTTKKVIWDATDYKGELEKSGTGIVKGVYLCDTPRVIGWQNSRSLHRGYKFANAEYKRDILPMLEKAIKVDNLRKLCFWGEYDCLGIR